MKKTNDFFRVLSKIILMTFVALVLIQGLQGMQKDEEGVVPCEEDSVESNVNSLVRQVKKSYEERKGRTDGNYLHELARLHKSLEKISKEVISTVVTRFINEYRCNINELSSSYKHYDDSGGTPLEEACLQGDSDLVNIFVEHGADYNIYGEGVPVWFCAMSNNNVAMIEALFKDGVREGAGVMGSNRSYCCYYGDCWITPLVQASRHRDFRRTLLKRDQSCAKNYFCCWGDKGCQEPGLLPCVCSACCGCCNGVIYEDCRAAFHCGYGNWCEGPCGECQVDPEIKEARKRHLKRMN